MYSKTIERLMKINNWTEKCIHACYAWSLDDLVDHWQKKRIGRESINCSNSRLNCENKRG